MPLTREDWIAAAMDAMRRGGIEAVRIEALARALKVSRGSFYWHFKSRAELLETLLFRWEEETAWLVAGASAAATPRERALRFFELANASPYPPDREMFAWARRDSKVARRVEVIEARRVAFFERVLLDAGASPERGHELAEILYLSTLGWLERRWRSPAGGYAFESFSNRVISLVLQQAVLQTPDKNAAVDS